MSYRSRDRVMTFITTWLKELVAISQAFWRALIAFKDKLFSFFEGKQSWSKPLHQRKGFCTDFIPAILKNIFRESLGKNRDQMPKVFDCAGT
ncbi:hypothetical protein [Limnothrix redekei]|uniref:Transposase DDE domain-containing protein n=1 Tax=Limnothrix redekei LRLZ20PSL1 TaxID=3112953 RepID=A0ABW7CAS4_9CYAN